MYYQKHRVKECSQILFKILLFRKTDYTCRVCKSSNSLPELQGVQHQVKWINSSNSQRLLTCLRRTRVSFSQALIKYNDTAVPFPQHAKLFVVSSSSLLVFLQFLVNDWIKLFMLLDHALMTWRENSVQFPKWRKSPWHNSGSGQTWGFWRHLCYCEVKKKVI